MTYRIILSFAVIFFSLVLWLRDVEKAYMQSLKLTWDVFTEPPPEANLPPHQLLKVVLPHYGLVESSSCFFDTYYPVFTEKLKMLAAFFEPCFLYRKVNGVLSGITGLATDDYISTGLPEYQHNEEKHTKQFITRKTAKLPFRFLGTLIEYDENKTGLCVSQDIHIKKLKLLSTDPINHDAFRSVRGQLLYISQTTRPDISYRVSQLCQVKHKQASRQHIKLLNETVQHLKDTTDVKLRYPKMDKESLSLYCFVDSGYNTNEDHTSQL